MPQLAKFQDKKTALILWNKADEKDAHVYLGTIELKNTIPHFVNSIERWDIELSFEALEEIKEVPDELKEVLLGANMFFSLPISDLIGEPSADDVATGMKWG